MKRTLAVAIAAVACVTLGGAWAIPALATARQGTLTSHEYALLVNAQTKLGTALRKTPVSWDELHAICGTVGSSTTLVKSERASCIAETRLLEGLVDFPSREGRCGTAQPRKDVCTAPLYTALAKHAKVMYDADVVERQRSTQRGFTGRCLQALANTTKQLGEQRDLATATEKLSKDVQLAVQIVEGKLPSSTISASQVEADAKAFEHDGDLVLGQNSPKLSSCPHQ
jgi:hypothetical protein